MIYPLGLNIICSRILYQTTYYQKIKILNYSQILIEMYLLIQKFSKVLFKNN
jgi:hypothetical protein